MEQHKEDYYIKRIESLEKKLEKTLKKKNKDNFVQKNLLLFKDILDKDGQVLGHQDLAQRYFYTHKRKGKEIPATKLNLFVQDILMAKVLLNQKIDEKDHAVRYSMAVDSLIKHLQKDRVKRPRSTTKASTKAVKESLPKPSTEEVAEAKRKAQQELIKRNMELAENKEPVKEEQKILKLPTADQTDFIKYEER